MRRLGSFVGQSHRGLVVIRLQDENRLWATNVAVWLFLGLEFQDRTITDTGLNLVAKGKFALVTVTGEQRGHRERTFRPTGFLRGRADVTPCTFETFAIGFVFLCHTLLLVFCYVYVCLCFDCENILLHFYKKSSLIKKSIILENPTFVIIDKYPCAH